MYILSAIFLAGTVACFVLALINGVPGGWPMNWSAMWQALSGNMGFAVMDEAHLVVTIGLIVVAVLLLLELILEISMCVRLEKKINIIGFTLFALAAAFLSTQTIAAYSLATRPMEPLVMWLFYGGLSLAALNPILRCTCYARML